MNITNVTVLVKPEESCGDTIRKLQEKINYTIAPDEPFCFGAILYPDKKNENTYKLRVNCADTDEDNPYSIEDICREVYFQEPRPGDVRYVRPPLDLWLRAFQPMLTSLVNRVRPRYEKLIPDRDDLVSILYLTVLRLYDRGYYLHKQLVFTSYINDLNLECRKLKNFYLESLDAPIGKDDNGKDITLLDQLADKESSTWAHRCTHYTQQDYKEDMFNAVRDAMLEDMSELAFDRILIQLKTNTVDRSTSYKLGKYREIFNPDYIPRPNARGKNKGGKK